MIGETLNLMREDICNLLCVFANAMTNENIDELGRAEVCAIAAKYGFMFDSIQEPILGTDLVEEFIRVRDIRK